MHCRGVSCPTTTACVAVGDAGTAGLLIEHWNGHGGWSIMTRDHPPVASSLAAVSCPTSRDCFAVGTQTVNATGHALFEHWDGHGSWTVMPGVGPANPNLPGLSCPAPANCYSAGSARPGTRQQTLVERYG